MTITIYGWSTSLSAYVGSYPEYYQNLPSLSDHTSVRILADAKRRREEFAEFINSGRTVVVMVRPPQECYVATGTREYSGTGRNRVATRHVAPFNLLSALPCTDVTFHLASGTRIALDGDGPVLGVLRKYKERIEYTAVIKNPPGTPLAHVAGTDRVVGSVQRSANGGHLILLPAVDLEADIMAEDNDDETGWIEEASQFQDDLLAAIEQLAGTKVISRPAWTQRFATEEQQKIRSEVVKQQARIEAARSKLTKLQQQQEAAEAKDQLFLGSGRTLELEVKAVLELLGGVVTEPEVGRDDWQVSFPEGDAVIEVKGVSKTAAEKYAAQLEKWVSIALENTGKMPKGILVVNTWRERPLDERADDDFPTQMLPYSTSRGHCLITGLQLYVMRAEVERDRTRAKELRKVLLETNGPVEGYDDWRSVIHEIKSDD